MVVKVTEIVKFEMAIDVVRTLRQKIIAVCRKLGIGVCLRTVMLIFCLTFFWVQMHMSDVADNETLQILAKPDGLLDANDSMLQLVPQHLHKYLVALPQRDRPHQAILPGNASEHIATAVSLNASEIRRLIDQQNSKQIVLNEDVYGPLQNDSLVIVIQVHTRIMYLRHTIVSLARARGIENALLIFSHDHYDEQINELIQMIDFCKTMQIFYPYSIQTHPVSFPGESPEDCPRDISKSDAIKRKCINAMHPDQYGHYREAKFTQTKHHWWWKANRVFNELDVVSNYSGPILFLEDDHYVAEDFIYMLKLMEKSCSVACPQCSMLSLGTYLKTYNFYGEAKKDILRVIRRQQIFAAELTPPSWSFKIVPSFSHYDKVEISQWISSKHNMGMAYNRTVWKQFVDCADTFCKYDDYNWDWSLQSVSNNCLSHEFKVFVLKAPRVFHIGECGVHHKKSCFDMALIAKVQKLLSSVYKYLFPEKLEVTYAPIKKKVLRKGNGGWGDVRDHELCLRMVNRQW
ncbi:alpha-1,6-mannosyl-glycoprotein 2-beta-N-acetylglucosaminyltransferase isoform X1 [Rhopalosiphum maidis]|uniref:alpha-1,6-mannosyl-glycoprotein 2-beta-N-acetylglucosaminyltransferase isoform X1 n=1 Tax=Rhopalosiphum maidis TaxID=43146 RepID=UPI000F001E7A|nr:alpha-1,6-mannosyl-glycoprotein 2-beta-N-acetylglucosaminyltransferase isoform X1 [Rhopalosiphum maidis]XP_026816320.1 alpha-1,6-mannosyl-glycoprotein 2-beta-N-acetylglucosaminyltransferase isoform X1 [Rhopalosiphum maidis]XP_026816321.1 alpha-1,6-mannosyl-glycoprotein 2-beta-N-acetylglucosaminyltransferase isoform X1 [Rhopalosiphum maidis]